MTLLATCVCTFGIVGTGASWISDSDKCGNNAVAVAKECKNCAATNGAELYTKLANGERLHLDACCMHVVVGEQGLFICSVVGFAAHVTWLTSDVAPMHISKRMTCAQQPMHSVCDMIST